MNVNEPTAHSAPEDLSDRSNTSSSETQLHAFQEYGKIKELNLSINRGKDPTPNKTKDFNFGLDGNRQHGLSFSSIAADRSTKDLPVALDKPKEFDFQPEKIKDTSSYSLDRSEDTDASLDTTKEYTPNLNRAKDNKDVIFTFDGIKDVHFPRESREARTKNINFPVDRNKDLNFQKAYNYPLDRIKDFNFALDRRRDSHVGGLTLERLRGGSFLEPTDYRNSQIQPRDELEAIAMRRSQILTSDIGPRNLPAHLSYPHSITEMQHSQQQQQEQGKSFTIASILGLRNNQRDNPQRSHPYRKHQGQEGSAKNGSSGSSSGGSGKLKRVRTIFTPEQLERLEGEFARQQYMVGPERLYLAHTLRLTEAQVKVWFQNRRIKWRKVHQEQQSQRLHELHSLSSLEQDVEDSNDNSDCRDAFKPEFPRASPGHPFLAGRRSEFVFLKPREILDTISEHTEPSPVPSTTMDQADLETQSQMRKLRRGRHATSYWPSWASRLPADGTSASDSYWKPGPRPTHSVPHGHEQRRENYGVAEPVTSCYSASNTYRPKHRAQTSVSPKAPPPPHIPTSDQTYRTPQHSVRTARNKLLTTNNLAVVRKTCGYKDEREEEEEVKYDEEDVNYAEENAEEEVAEEVDEDPDETYEYNDKDYEEQEADDEVDDESDAFQTQLNRAQHKVQKASNHRAQQLRHAEQQQDLRRIQHQQHVHKMYQDQKLPRFYPQTMEPHQQIARDTSYGDVAEVISDDQHTPPWTPNPRKSSRRMSETHQTVSSWVPPRKSAERSRDRVISPVVTAQEHQRHQRHRQHHQQEQQQQQQQQQQHHQQQQLRRHRTMKPEIESLMMPPPSHENPKKCCICGGSTAPVTMRVGSPGKGNCRLHEYRGFTVKGPPGEDGEAEEQVVCGRCAKRHNMEDIRLGCEASSPEVAAPLYAAKPHRSGIHHRSSTYDCPEDSPTVDEMLAAYTSSQPRASTLDYATPPRGRTRHSVQSARSPLRRASYYER